MSMVLDSDPLRKRLRHRGIELISPHKKNRVRPATQDGRALRCGGIGGAGSSSAPSAGSVTSVGWSCAMTLAANLPGVLYISLAS
jgi:hypothetical protein